jgi:hypothetical protein
LGLVDAYSLAGDLTGDTTGLTLGASCIACMLMDYLDLDRSFYLFRLSLISVNLINLR